MGYCIFYDDADYCSDGEISPCAAVNDPVYVTLTGGSVWNATGASYLDRLTVEADSTINGIVNVDNEPVDVTVGGTLEGNIAVVVRPNEYGISTMPLN